MPTPLEIEIAEMRARGFDRTTLDRVRREREQQAAGLELISLIEDVFAGVQLGDGVGLIQGQGLDDYESEIVCARYREQDEKDDWRRIPVDLLNRCYSSLSFFDAEGMRFHLPAFLVAELRGEYGFGILHTLTELSDYNVSRFALLSPAQRAAVRAVLWHLPVGPNKMHDGEIERALVEYWNEALDQSFGPSSRVPSAGGANA